MDAASVIQALEAALPEAVIAKDPTAKDPWVQVAPGAVAGVVRWLRDTPEMAFDFLMSLTGMDLAGLAEQPDLRVVYHLFSYRHRHTLVVRADCAREHPELPTVSSLYPIGNWYEREAFDLLGIVFKGHPDLRRILLPPEWEGHPLRKDWKEGPTALGFPTTRDTIIGGMKNRETPAPTP